MLRFLPRDHGQPGPDVLWCCLQTGIPALFTPLVLVDTLNVLELLKSSSEQQLESAGCMQTAHFDVSLVLILKLSLLCFLGNM